MFGFLRSKQKRIILINFEGLSIYALHRNSLVNIAKFSDEDSGYENFRHYLSDNPRTPVTLMVDSAVEDFIVETVSHVNPFDRKSFLERKTDHHFRGIEFRAAHIVGREDSGRREDKVLFSAITKNQIIEPWVRMLLAEEVPIKSITSPAYALCKVAKEFSLLTSDNVLLVNWELSGIRQTLIVGGKMMFSRMTPLPYDIDINLADSIMESSEQSRAYLERIGLLNYDQPLDVHIITPHLSDDSFSNSVDSPGFRLVMHHNSIDLMQIDRFSGPQKSITANLLCIDWALRRGEYGNVYGTLPVLRFHQLIQLRKLIGASSLAILVLAVLVSAPLILDGIERRARTAQLIQDVVPVQAQHDALRAQFPETPIPSEAMELAVNTYDLINSQIKFPFDLFTAVSDVMSQHPAIELTGLEWKLGGAQSDQNFTTLLLNNQSQVSLELYGILLESVSIQDSDTRLRQFFDSLGEIDGVTVSPISLPVEPGPFSEVTTVIDDEVVDEEFAVILSLDS